MNNSLERKEENKSSEVIENVPYNFCLWLEDQG